MSESKTTEREAYEARRQADEDREIANAVLPSPGAIAKAIRATKYKYFGDYEFDENQREAVATLVATARVYLRALREAASDPT